MILCTSNEETIRFAAIALIISIASFFWRLFPLIRKMDREDQLDPKNYSKVLGWMILGFILVFILSFLLTP